MEDDGEEVGEGGGDEVEEEEERGEGVEFGVEEGGEDCGEREGVVIDGGGLVGAVLRSLRDVVAGVRAVDVDAGDCQGGFFVGEEEKGLVGVFGEVDDPEIGD